MRPTTLVLTATSADTPVSSIANQVASAANVTAVVSDGSGPLEPDGLRATWMEIERVHNTYVLTDADPLDGLCRAYVQAWRERQLERLDIAALEPAPLPPRPDFYLVLDDGSPDPELESERALRREWYFGVVARAAPARVLAARAGAAAEHAAAAVTELLAALPAGPEIPSAAALVALARKRVPGQSDSL